MSTLLPEVGLGPKEAVTPEGSPEAVSVTLPLKPFWPVTVMVAVLVLPCVMVRDAAELVRANPGCDKPFSAMLCEM